MSQQPYRDDPRRIQGGDVDSDDEDDSLLQRGAQGAMKLWDGFVNFALQGNILEIALGMILAATFTKLVNSFVRDILMPPISVIIPLNRNMEEKFAVLRRGPNYDVETGYNTLQQALDDGAVVMAIGSFINQIVSFTAVGVSLYFLAIFYQWCSHDPIIKYNVKCRYCRKQISIKAKRCVNCTSWLDGREEKFREAFSLQGTQSHNI